MADANFNSEDAKGRAIRPTDLVFAADPDEADFEAAARSDTLAELIATIFGNPPDSLTTEQRQAVRVALGLATVPAPPAGAGSQRRILMGENGAYSLVNEIPEFMIPALIARDSEINAPAIRNLLGLTQAQLDDLVTEAARFGRSIRFRHADGTFTTIAIPSDATDPDGVVTGVAFSEDGTMLTITIDTDGTESSIEVPVPASLRAGGGGNGVGFETYRLPQAGGERILEGASFGFHLTGGDAGDAADTVIRLRRAFTPEDDDLLLSPSLHFEAEAGSGDETRIALIPINARFVRAIATEAARVAWPGSGVGVPAGASYVSLLGPREEADARFAPARWNLHYCGSHTATLTTLETTGNTEIGLTPLDAGEGHGIQAGHFVWIGGAVRIEVESVAGNTITLVSPGLSVSQVAGARVYIDDGRGFFFTQTHTDQDNVADMEFLLVGGASGAVVEVGPKGPPTATAETIKNVYKNSLRNPPQIWIGYQRYEHTAPPSITSALQAAGDAGYRGVSYLAPTASAAGDWFWSREGHSWKYRAEGRFHNIGFSELKRVAMNAAGDALFFNATDVFLNEVRDDAQAAEIVANDGYEAGKRYFYIRSRGLRVVSTFTAAVGVEDLYEFVELGEMVQPRNPVGDNTIVAVAANQLVATDIDKPETDWAWFNPGAPYGAWVRVYVADIPDDGEADTDVSADATKALSFPLDSAAVWFLSANSAGKITTGGSDATKFPPNLQMRTA